MTEDVDPGNGNADVNVEQQSQSLSGPSESSDNGPNAWTQRLRSSGSRLMLTLTCLLEATIVYLWVAHIEAHCANIDALNLVESGIYIACFMEMHLHITYHAINPHQSISLPLHKFY